jgi:hypothetical protein
MSGDYDYSSRRMLKKSVKLAERRRNRLHHPVNQWLADNPGNSSCQDFQLCDSLRLEMNGTSY